MQNDSKKVSILEFWGLRLIFKNLFNRKIIQVLFVFGFKKIKYVTFAASLSSVQFACSARSWLRLWSNFRPSWILSWCRPEIIESLPKIWNNHALYYISNIAYIQLNIHASDIIRFYDVLFIHGYIGNQNNLPQKM